MATMLLEINAEMESGEVYKVVADQRDIAKWEIQEFGCPFPELESRSMLGMRWLAWHALHRMQRVTMTWSAFDALCIEAGPPTEEDETVNDVADPGPSVPSEAP